MVLAGASVRVVLVVAAAALASEAWVGHAAVEAGFAGALRRGVMVVHLLAAGAWLGGFVPLSRLLLEPACRAGPAACCGVHRARRFSRVGYVAVGLVLLSGVANTYFLAAAGGPFSAPYGLVLAVKLGLVAGLLGLALANRALLLPQLRKGGSAGLAALTALERNVMLEQLLGLLVLGSVSVLGLLPPSA